MSGIDEVNTTHPAPLSRQPLRMGTIQRFTISAIALLFISGCTTASPEEKLRQAATDGNLLRVDTFLNQGVDVHSTDAKGTTPLFLAAQHGHQQVVARLLEQGASVNQPRQDGVTPLFVAARQGHRDIVALFLNKGANVNAQSGVGGVTLLHVSTYRNDYALVTLLLQHGADKHARMSSGERPIDLARQQGYTALIPLLEP